MAIKLNDMSPLFSRKNALYGVSIDFKKFCYFPLGKPCGVQSSSLPHCFISYRGIMMFFSNAGMILPSLVYHILHVVLVGTTKKMGRIAARTIIATVANVTSFWDRSIGQFKRYPMRISVEFSFFIFSIACLAIKRLFPWPTLIGPSYLNISPKPNRIRWLLIPSYFCTFKTAIYVGLFGSGIHKIDSYHPS